jgi:xanthine dehydrogenase accessory factor
MLFSRALRQGYFSGGCVEDDLARHASDVMATGESRQIRYGQGSPWWDIRLACGSGIDIFLEALDPDDAALSALIEFYVRRAPCLWQSGSQIRTCVATAHEIPPAVIHSAPFQYTKYYEPTRRLIVFGDDPTALSLVTSAKQNGFETHLVTTNGPIEPPPINGISYHRSTAETVFKTLLPDPWTAIVITAHDTDLVEIILKTAVQGPIGYLGAVGSISRRATHVGRLVAGGVPASLAEQLRMPVGLAGMGKAPSEVAISIMAELMQRYSARNS